MKSTFQNFWPIYWGPRSGALTQIKVPICEWLYHPQSEDIFFYSKGKFYAHARDESIVGIHPIFSTQRTCTPMAKGNVHPAMVDSMYSGLTLVAYDETVTMVW